MSVTKAKAVDNHTNTKDTKLQNVLIHKPFLLEPTKNHVKNEEEYQAENVELLVEQCISATSTNLTADHNKGIEGSLTEKIIDSTKQKKPPSWFVSPSYFFKSRSHSLSHSFSIMPSNTPEQ